MFNSKTYQLGTIFLSVVIALASTGCGSDTVQNTLNQERDRQRTKSADLEAEYQKIAGSYVSADSATIQKSGKSELLADNNNQIIMVAKFYRSYKLPDGNLVQQPVVSGEFNMFQRSDPAAPTSATRAQRVVTNCKNIGSTAPECGVFFNFSGVYDSTAKVLTGKVPAVGVNDIDVSCVLVAAQLWNCRWQPNSAGGMGFNFVLQSSTLQ